MKFYYKYLFIFITAILCGLGLHCLLFFLNLGVPMEQERYLHEWLEKKAAYADSISGQKIVFISGSNTLFGVDTERIEKSLGIPTVNYGTHATLKFYNLHLAKPHLHPGDIVILPLEYDTYTWHHNVYGTECALYWLGYKPEVFNAMQFDEKVHLISQISTTDLVKFFGQQIFPLQRKETNYSSKHLNTNGDMTNNLISNSNSSLQSIIPEKVFTELPVSSDAQKELLDFISFCRINNIIVYAAWPNYLWKDAEFTGNDLKSIHAIEKFYQENHVEILGNYTDCLYDVDLFYDTNYHLNDKGKRIHTDYLINLLKDKLSQR